MNAWRHVPRELGCSGVTAWQHEDDRVERRPIGHSAATGAHLLGRLGEQRLDGLPELLSRPGSTTRSPPTATRASRSSRPSTAITPSSSRSSPSSRAGHRRAQGPGARALPLRALPRQRRLERARTMAENRRMTADQVVDVSLSLICRNRPTILRARGGPCSSRLPMGASYTTFIDSTPKVASRESRGARGVRRAPQRRGSRGAKGGAVGPAKAETPAALLPSPKHGEMRCLDFPAPED